MKWRTPSSAHISLTASSSPSSSSQTSSWPSYSISRAASSVGRTISSGSVPGTMVVRKATRRSGSGCTGTGSRARSVARQSVATFRNANQPMTPVVTVITIDASRTTGPLSVDGQWLGSISQMRKPPTNRSAASTSRKLRIGRERSSRRNCTRKGRRLRQRPCQPAVALVVIGSIRLPLGVWHPAEGRFPSLPDQQAWAD